MVFRVPSTGPAPAPFPSQPQADIFHGTGQQVKERTVRGGRGSWWGRGGGAGEEGAVRPVGRQAAGWGSSLRGGKSGGKRGRAPMAPQKRVGEGRIPCAWPAFSGHQKLVCNKSSEVQISFWSFPRKTQTSCVDNHADFSFRLARASSSATTPSAAP